MDRHVARTVSDCGRVTVMGDAVHLVSARFVRSPAMARACRRPGVRMRSEAMGPDAVRDDGRAGLLHIVETAAVRTWLLVWRTSIRVSVIGMVTW
jgi:hypothetical protein